MTNKIKIIILLIIITSCSTKRISKNTKPLFEILVSAQYGGNKFEFYELITEENEFKMLLSDDELSKLVQPKDIKTANFILANLGEKNTGGYKIVVDKIEELPDKIKIYFKTISPKPGANVTMAITNPYCVVKINSKKPIEIE